MNVNRIIRNVLMTTLILVLGFAVSPASADAPVYEVWLIDEDIPVTNECGLDITSHQVGTLTNKIWLDENGDIDKAHQNWEATETWEANGKTLEFKYNYPARGWFETYYEGYAFYLGAYMITLPHEGVVYAATGLESYHMIRDAGGNIIITDELIKQVGNWQVDWPALCEYFAP